MGAAHQCLQRALVRRGDLPKWVAPKHLGAFLSFQIINLIKKVKGMKHLHKCVLEAWAMFAHKDGTGIRPSVESVAERAGVSRTTVWRITKDLLKSGVLVDTGERHDYHHGHYVPIYKIDAAMLLGETQLGKNLCSHEKRRNVSRRNKARCHGEHRSVATGSAILPYDPTRSPLAHIPPGHPSAAAAAAVAAAVKPKEKTHGSPMSVPKTKPTVISPILSCPSCGRTVILPPGWDETTCSHCSQTVRRSA